MNQNQINKLQYFRNFLRKNGFSSCFIINKDKDISFSFEKVDKHGYKIIVEIDKQKQIDNILNISITALKDIFNKIVTFEEFLPNSSFDSSTLGFLGTSRKEG